MAQNLHEGQDNLTPRWVVCPHAAQPQAILLCAVVDGQFVFLDELHALARREAQRIPSPFQGVEELAAVIVFPRSGVDRTAPQADHYREVLNSYRALILAAAASSALKDRLL